MKFFDRVRIATATAGTGTLTFGAVTSNAFETPTEAGAADADVTPYLITQGSDYEIGSMTIGGGVTTGTRTVIRSKISGSVGVTKITLDGSTAVVRFIASAAEFNALQGAAPAVIGSLAVQSNRALALFANGFTLT